MHAVDLVVVAAYLVTTVWLGKRLSRGQTGVRDYFLTGHRVPWWAVMGSIVATETSTVTLISVPGYAFGSDLTFLQLAAGYVVGRFFVALVLIPPYFRGEFVTAYQLLARRFDRRIGRVTAVMFLATRNISDGLRLFATGVVLAAAVLTRPASQPTPAVLANAAPDTLVLVASTASETIVLVAAIAVIALVTLAYTWLGGMLAVVWLDVAQLAIYIGGSVIAAALLLGTIPGGWTEVMASGHAAGKLTVLDLTWTLTKDYTFWSAVVGGAFLTAATHGTDQMFVQRYLCCSSSRDARRALVVSGAVVFVQFALFLAIGVMLWVYYTAHAPGLLDAVVVDDQVQADRVFPLFLMTHLPVGVRGLMVAAIVAAAMSTLSSSLNSSAASTVGDFYMPWAGRGRADADYLRVARLATIGWGALQVAVALVAIQLSSRLIDEVLAVQFFTGGLLLGVFLMGALMTTRSPAAASTGLGAGLVATLSLALFTAVSYQWYTLIGSMTTLGVGWSAQRIRAPHARNRGHD